LSIFQLRLFGTTCFHLPSTVTTARYSFAVQLVAGWVGLSIVCTSPVVRLAQGRPANNRQATAAQPRTLDQQVGLRAKRLAHTATAAVYCNVRDISIDFLILLFSSMESDMIQWPKAYKVWLICTFPNSFVAHLMCLVWRREGHPASKNKSSQHSNWAAIPVRVKELSWRNSPTRAEHGVKWPKMVLMVMAMKMTIITSLRYLLIVWAIYRTVLFRLNCITGNHERAPKIVIWSESNFIHLFRDGSRLWSILA